MVLCFWLQRYNTLIRIRLCMKIIAAFFCTSDQNNIVPACWGQICVCYISFSWIVVETRLGNIFVACLLVLIIALVEGKVYEWNGTFNVKLVWEVMGILLYRSTRICKLHSNMTNPIMTITRRIYFRRNILFY